MRNLHLKIKEKNLKKQVMDGTRRRLSETGKQMFRAGIGKDGSVRQCVGELYKRRSRWVSFHGVVIFHFELSGLILCFYKNVVF